MSKHNPRTVFPQRYSLQQEKIFENLVEIFKDSVDADVIRLVLDETEWKAEEAIEQIIQLTANGNPNASEYRPDLAMIACSLLDDEKAAQSADNVILAANNDVFEDQKQWDSCISKAAVEEFSTNPLHPVVKSESESSDRATLFPFYGPSDKASGENITGDETDISIPTSIVVQQTFYSQNHSRRIPDNTGTNVRHANLSHCLQTNPHIADNCHTNQNNGKVSRTQISRTCHENRDRCYSVQHPEQIVDSTTYHLHSTSGKSLTREPSVGTMIRQAGSVSTSVSCSKPNLAFSIPEKEDNLLNSLKLEPVHVSLLKESNTGYLQSDLSLKASAENVDHSAVDDVDATLANTMLSAIPVLNLSAEAPEFVPCHQNSQPSDFFSPPADYFFTPRILTPYTRIQPPTGVTELFSNQLRYHSVPPTRMPTRKNVSFENFVGQNLYHIPNVSPVVATHLGSPTFVSSGQMANIGKVQKSRSLGKLSISEKTPLPDTPATFSAINKLKKVIQSGTKILILMRGLPGSGKSTLARQIQADGEVFSADDYFMQNGEYIYNQEQLSDAHAWNKQRVRSALDSGISPIVVDNTNLMMWEMLPYAQLAEDRGYAVEIIEPETPWKFQPKRLAKLNIHGVKIEALKKMKDRYETIDTAKLKACLTQTSKSKETHKKSAEIKNPALQENSVKSRISKLSSNISSSSAISSFSKNNSSDHPNFNPKGKSKKSVKWEDIQGLIEDGATDKEVEAFIYMTSLSKQKKKELKQKAKEARKLAVSSKELNSHPDLANACVVMESGSSRQNHHDDKPVDAQINGRKVIITPENVTELKTDLAWNEPKPQRRRRVSSKTEYIEEQVDGMQSNEKLEGFVQNGPFIQQDFVDNNLLHDDVRSIVGVDNSKLGELYEDKVTEKTTENLMAKEPSQSPSFVPVDCIVKADRNISDTEIQNLHKVNWESYVKGLLEDGATYDEVEASICVTLSNEQEKKQMRQFIREYTKMELVSPALSETKDDVCVPLENNATIHHDISRPYTEIELTCGDNKNFKCTKSNCVDDKVLIGFDIDLAFNSQESYCIPKKDVLENKMDTEICLDDANKMSDILAYKMPKTYSAEHIYQPKEFSVEEKIENQPCIVKEKLIEEENQSFHSCPWTEIEMTGTQQSELLGAVNVSSSDSEGNSLVDVEINANQVSDHDLQNVPPNPEELGNTIMANHAKELSNTTKNAEETYSGKSNQKTHSKKKHKVIEKFLVDNVAAKFNTSWKAFSPEKQIDFSTKEDKKSPVLDIGVSASTGSASTQTEVRDLNFLFMLETTDSKTCIPSEEGYHIVFSRGQYNSPRTDNTVCTIKSLRHKPVLDKGVSTNILHSTEPGLELLVSCFPEVAAGHLQEVLEVCHGNVEWAVNLLLDWGITNPFTVNEKHQIHEEIARRCLEQYSSNERSKQVLNNNTPPKLFDLCQQVIGRKVHSEDMQRKIISSALQRLERIESSELQRVRSISSDSSSKDAINIPFLDRQFSLSDFEASTPVSGKIHSLEKLSPKGKSDSGHFLHFSSMPLSSQSFENRKKQVETKAAIQTQDRGQGFDRSENKTKASGQKATDTMNLSVSIPITLLRNLEQLFGPLPGSVQSSSVTVSLDHTTAHHLHGCLAKSLLKGHLADIQQKEKQMREDQALAQMLQAEEEIDSVLQSIMSPPLAPSIGKVPSPHHHNRQQISGSSKYGHSSVRLSLPPVNLQDIMEEEMKKQQLQELQMKQLEASGDHIAIATKLKREKLHQHFPGIDDTFLEEIFQANSYCLESTLRVMESALGDKQPVDNKLITMPASVSNADLPLDPVEENQRIEAAKRQSLLDLLDMAWRKGDYQRLDAADNSVEYQELRQEANIHHRLRGECFEKAQEAYRRGMRDVAVFYSQQGHQHTEKMKDANMRASEKILQARQGRLNVESTLDLHGLHVDEAVIALRHTLDEKEKEYSEKPIYNRQFLYVITGRGKHSQNGVSRIRPAVVSYLNSTGHRYMELHAGMLRVTLHPVS